MIVLFPLGLMVMKVLDMVNNRSRKVIIRSKKMNIPKPRFVEPDILGQKFWVCQGCGNVFPSNPHVWVYCESCAARILDRLHDDARVFCPMGEGRCD